MHAILQQFSADDYLLTLPEATATITRAAFASGMNPIDIVFEVVSQPSAGLSTRGSALWPRETLQKIAKEAHLAICTDDPKYADFRSKLNGESKITALVIVNLLSNAVAANVDVLLAMCVPLVALLMAAASKTGFAGWCAAMKDATAIPVAGDPPQQNS
jgi:hypothetical protein